jgi:hypothetical protein
MNPSLTPQETVTLVLGVSTLFVIVFFLFFASLRKEASIIPKKMVKSSVSPVKVQICMLERAIEGVELDQVLKERMAEAISVLPNLEA